MSNSSLILIGVGHREMSLFYVEQSFRVLSALSTLMALMSLTPLTSPNRKSQNSANHLKIAQCAVKRKNRIKCA